MKLLRILTGLHAGAELQLDVLSQRIGADHAADIRLTDWTAPSMQLSFDENGEVQLEILDDASPSLENETDMNLSLLPSQTLSSKMMLANWVPQRFGEVVLCVGQVGEDWPSDAELLSLLLPLPVAEEDPQDNAAKGPLSATVPIRYKRLLLLTGIVILSAIALNIGMLNRVKQRARAEYESTVNTLPNQIERALNQARITGLKMVAQGDGIVLNGIVANSAEDNAVRQIADTLNSQGRITLHYDVASRVAQNIAESLNRPNIKVQYLGNGVFQVSGVVADLASAQQALARLAPDLSSNIKQIDSQLTAAKPNNAPAYSGLLSDGNVKYFETPDGVKHLYTNDQSE